MYVRGHVLGNLLVHVGEICFGWKGYFSFQRRKLARVGIDSLDVPEGPSAITSARGNPAASMVPPGWEILRISFFRVFAALEMLGYAS